LTLYVGLMSGTSMDGIDAVLVDFEASASTHVADTHVPFDAALRDELLALNASGADELHRAAKAANALADAQAAAVQQVLANAGVEAASVRAVGSHGQTVRHRPDAGYTLQINNGARLAEHCGIDVVCDFRSRDVAAGGQGAPLVPAFHAERFAAAGEARAVLNLGGIANLTLLGADGSVGGFDTGPASALLDGWCMRHRGQAFDDGGRWSASGAVIHPLLSAMLAEPFLRLPPPKSTGRDLFNPAWLEAHLQRASPMAAAADVQATLAELTARSVAEALLRHAPATRRLLVCGGGALNDDLMRRLARLLPGVPVESTAAHGIAPTHVEATAFAWLARAFVERRPGNRTDVTGARGPRVLGALYPK
jgi:anhydro-N-acetylmuramic acid kinase